jgi:hypothetical protein
MNVYCREIVLVTFVVLQVILLEIAPTSSLVSCMHFITSSCFHLIRCVLFFCFILYSFRYIILDAFLSFYLKFNQPSFVTRAELQHSLFVLYFHSFWRLILLLLPKLMLDFKAGHLDMAHKLIGQVLHSTNTDLLSICTETQGLFLLMLVLILLCPFKCLLMFHLSILGCLIPSK